MRGQHMLARRAILVVLPLGVLLLGYAHAAADEPHLVKDIKPGSDDGDPMSLAVVKGQVYFRADDGTNGDELWKSDGTEEGTAMVKDINPGSEGSDPADLFSAYGLLYFVATDGIHGWELWKSDGTETGTAMIMDINPGSGDSYPRDFRQAGNRLLFTAVDGSHGRELWALEIVPEPAQGVPPVVPEASTLLLLTGGSAGLLTYVGMHLRARRRAGTRDKRTGTAHPGKDVRQSAQ